MKTQSIFQIEFFTHEQVFMIETNNEKIFENILQDPFNYVCNTQIWDVVEMSVYKYGKLLAIKTF